jgi:hypothetical protein
MIKMGCLWSRFKSIQPGDLPKIGFEYGLLNYEFTASFDAFEFCNYRVEQKIILFTHFLNAWLLKKDDPTSLELNVLYDGLQTKLIGVHALG